MNDAYSDFVRGLMKDMGSKRANLVHAALGIGGEAGEVVDLVKKHWAYEKPLDTDKVVEEVGDVLFYVQALCNEIGVSPSFILQKNVEKLSRRFPTGSYSNQQAIDRADKNDAN